MTDVQRLLEAANPIMETDEDPGSVPPFESIWRAVQDSEGTLARPRRRLARIAVPASPRRRIVLSGVVVATVAAAALAAVNLLPASGTPVAVSDAVAKQVITRAAAVLSGTGSGILHIAETIRVVSTASGSPRTIHTSTVESWDSETAPLAYWSTARGTGGFGKTVIADDTIEFYDSLSNTIQELRNAPPMAESWRQYLEEPYLGRVVFLLRQQDPGAFQRLLSSGAQAPETFPAEFGQLVKELLSASGVTVNSAASVNGAPAISLANNSLGYAYTLYVQPKTYTPLEFTSTQVGGSEPRTLITTFTTWETLPAGSVPIPDLTQLYPNARVVPMS